MRYITLLIVLAACKTDGEGDGAAVKPTEAPRKLAGVFPSDFKCTSIASLEVIGQTLGGTARAKDSSSVTQGIAHPCAYEIMTATGPEYWTFDFDCRDNYKQQADILFAQYTQISADMVQAYNAEAAAHVHAKPNPDAGPPGRPPELASEVAVGSKGLDHRGQGLIFIDDDAPCYVRIAGLDAGRRLELAKLIAKNLTFANAPMTPRPLK